MSTNYIWVIILIIGIIIGIIALFLINRRLNDPEATISGSLWLFLFLAVLLILISFAVYLYYSDKVTTKNIYFQPNWESKLVHNHPSNHQHVSPVVTHDHLQEHHHEHTPSTNVTIVNERREIPTRFVHIEGDYD